MEGHTTSRAPRQESAVLVRVDREEQELLEDVRLAISGWLNSYNDVSQRGRQSQMKVWHRYCTEHGFNILQAKRGHIEEFARDLERTGRMKSTVAGYISTLASFYRYCFLEDIIRKDPAAYVRRPKIAYMVQRPYLDRNELSKYLMAAEDDARAHALVCLLGLNGLRINEALTARIETLGQERGHHTLVINGKGGKIATVPLAPRTARAVLYYIGERTVGPIFLGWEGNQMDRHAAARIVNSVAKRAGITKHLTPHSMRRSFITCALDAGVSLRDVQLAARHADPRTTTIYDMGRRSLDTHATYIVAAFVTGGS